jgi:REP element-mobilizing transposase RayT
VVWGAYGFWLPNDPRGSWSDFVGSWRLARFGPATKIESRRSVAGAAHDRQLRVATKTALKFPPVHLTGRQALAIGQGFSAALTESAYKIYACAILPEHVHLVIKSSERPITMAVAHLKGRATQQLKSAGLWPDPTKPVWAKKCWRVFLNNEEEVLHAIAYVENNPLKEGKPRQRWSFVVPF